MDERTRALERLYRDRYVAFRNTLATVTGSNESARDVVQEAFARALRKRKSWHGDGSLEACVWRIAFRTAQRIRPTEGYVLHETPLAHLPAREAPTASGRTRRARP
jgi:DNA-directed RNA polymerase specialized sigma24 family protein